MGYRHGCLRLDRRHVSQLCRAEGVDNIIPVDILHFWMPAAGPGRARRADEDCSQNQHPAVLETSWPSKCLQHQTA